MNNNAPPSHEDALLSSAQVERLLGLSPTSVWRLTRRGDLVPVYIGAALWFGRPDVLALMLVGTSGCPPLAQVQNERGIRRRHARHRHGRGAERGHVRAVCEGRGFVGDLTHHASLREYAYCAAAERIGAPDSLRACYTNNWGDLVHLPVEFRVHGHTHAAVNAEVVGTSLVSNPLGLKGGPGSSSPCADSHWL